MQPELPKAWQPFAQGGTITGAAAAAPKSLVTKLAEVMAAVERIPKRGRNQHFGYDFATEADIVAAVRKELAARHVMLIPQVDDYAVQELAPKKNGEAREPLAILRMTFTFYDGETGETLVKPWIGVGQDSGDKGIYKAMTGGDKYFLLKSFLIPTGDDPERDGTTTKKVQRRGEPAPPETVVDAHTGEERPASDRPAPPSGYRYIDGCEQKNNGWYEVRFNFPHGPRIYSTKKEQVGALAMEAYQQGVPVRVEGKAKKDYPGEYYLDMVHPWAPDLTNAELDAEIAARDLAAKAGEIA